jgi:hypothetical protein
VNVVEILRIFVKFVERNTRGRNIWPTITGRTQKKRHSNVKFVASRLPAKSILRHIFYGTQVRTCKSDYLRMDVEYILFLQEKQTTNVTFVLKRSPVRSTFPITFANIQVGNISGIIEYNCV